VLKGLQALHLSCLAVQRYATVHRELKCSSAHCQTCEEHFEANKKQKGTNPTMLCKLNKSLVYCLVSVLILSQRSNNAQMIIKLLFDILKCS